MTADRSASMSPMPWLLRHRTAVTVLGNLAVATAAYVLAFALRFDLGIPAKYAGVMLATTAP